MGLLETKISDFNIRDVKKIMGDGWEYAMVPSNGLSGGIIVLWNSNIVDYSLVGSSSQCLIGNLTINNKCKWRIASVYGSKDLNKRRELWELIEFYLVEDHPMVVGGDFNCLTSKEDKRGGKKFLFSQGAKEMEAFITNNDLHEIGFIGQRFTWCNNKSGGARILERLDRCFLNSFALNHFSQLTVRHLARIASDHSPLVLNLCNSSSFKKRSIIFEDVWASYPASFAVVKREWSKNCKVFQLKVKQRNCRLEEWPKQKNILKQEEINSLSREFTVEEIDLVIQNLGKNIDPGSDGVTFSFIKFYWKIINEDFVKALNHFFNQGSMDCNWKDTLVVLIPKVSNPLLPSNYRPISLCNSVYKVAAKVILNRLMSVIPMLISDEQATFIRGRSISDHILIAQEMFHKFRYSKATKGWWRTK
ncbi:uncharacterized protein LOC110116355 [Dendrobium catenatum]|uniref:uncharacterized protein LOC110116355 n=1 Tax=Dendrobium catenatum TaxID=906689 RepID=UPI0009F17ABA|nr:uncharacterized protein LOC110116355 [Dendrobium catenatum]